MTRRDDFGAITLDVPGKEKHLYLVDFAMDPSLPTWTLKTHMPCEVGDTIFRPVSAKVGTGIVRAKIVARDPASPPYAARLTIEDADS
jgi:hypothetical protein